MTTILQEAAAGRAAIVPWTIEQYHKAIETGFLPDDPSIELLDGLIVRKDRARAGDDRMTIGDRHRIAVLRLSHMASWFDSRGCFLQTQQPVALPPISEPEPDGAVVRGRIDDYMDHPPTASDVCSVIEVADSSLSVDLGPKLRAYAAAGIPQYIVIDLVNNRVVFHERPAGGAYDRVTIFERGSTIHIATPDGDIALPTERLLP